MRETVKEGHIIAVRNLDESWGRLDTALCNSVNASNTFAHDYLVLHKTRNRRWYVEKHSSYSGKGAGIAQEVTLDAAMDWLLEHVCDFRELSKRGYFENLPDVAESATPGHGGGIIVKCVRCRELILSERRSQCKTEKAIIAALKRKKTPRSGREISISASLKYNSNFRAALSRLVARSIVVKHYGKGGYGLADRCLS
jgi:hypothetical protein